jgi:transposase
MTKEEFYQELLGLPRPWRVARVVLDKAAGRVDVWLMHPEGLRWNCPLCRQALAIYDHVPERLWRHLDTCEYRTFLHARLPRVECPKHGVVQVGAPWAEGDSKTTVAMESRCIDVLQECDVSGAGRLTGLSWERLWEVLERAVARGRDRKAQRLPRYLGMDEKSFAKGHQYETLVWDLQRGTVEYVEDERKEASLASYFAGFTEAARARVIAVAMDMWDPYIAAVRKSVPDGEEKIVFDRFHVMRHMSKAVDDVRRREHKELWSRGDATLKGTRYLWLWEPREHPQVASARLRGLAQEEPEGEPCLGDQGEPPAALGLRVGGGGPELLRPLVWMGDAFAPGPRGEGGPHAQALRGRRSPSAAPSDHQRVRRRPQQQDRDHQEDGLRVPQPRTL